MMPAIEAPRSMRGVVVRYAIPGTLAALDPARHQVVEASAGTGKTYLIEHRVVDLLLSTDTPVEQILVVTFTEKATAELRFRVRRLIEAVQTARAHTAAPDEPHWQVDDLARGRLEEALLGFDRAAIYTIHSFCQRVLTENAFANRRLFAQTQVTSEESFADAFKAALREDLARDPVHRPYLAAWHRSGKTVDDLEHLLFRCASQNGRLVPEYDEAALASRLRAAAAELPAFDVDTDGVRLRQALKAAGLHPSSVKSVLDRLGRLRTCLDRFALNGDVPGCLALYEAKDHTLLTFLAERLQSADIDHAGLRAARDVVLDLDQCMVPLAAAVAQRFLPQVVGRMEAEKNRRGQFDFHDMLGLVWRSLDSDDGGGDELAARLRERYRYALIDEFQDTDEIQWQIFRRLYLDSEDNRLCIIGDPKQAIYGFRGADVFTYLEARREVQERGGQVTNLIDNYRSTDGLVRAYNTIFEDRFFTGDIRYDHPVRAATDMTACDAAGEPIAPVCVWHVVPDQGKLHADPLRQSLLVRMAGEIGRLLAAGEPKSAGDGAGDGAAGGARGRLAPGNITVGPPDAQVPVHAGDIFVLTRTTSESNDVAAHLRQAGIPCAIYKQEGLFQTHEAQEVHDLLGGIAEPQSRSARFKAWTTRFFGATLSDLPYLSDLPETHPFVARLYDWKGLADRFEYEKLFSRILDQSGIIERELFLDTSERALTNFQHLFELLLEDVMRSRCELHELIQRLQRWITGTGGAQADDRNVQRLESERNSVQVMTIHRAKGLEAKVVFLYGGFGGFPGDEVQVYHDSGERLVHVGHAHRDIAGAVERESQSEAQRLLYVALTRAVARLYLPYAAPEDFQSMRGTYAQLNRRLEDIVHRVRGGDGELGRLFVVERVAAGGGGGARAAARVKHLLREWQPPRKLLAAPPAAIDYERVRAERAGFVVASYTSMKRAGPSTVAFISEDAPGAGGDTGPARPMAALSAIDFQGDEAATGVRAAEDELPGGAQSGVFLHNVLEHVPFDSAAGVDFDTWRALPAIEQLFADAMLRFNRDPQHLRYSQQVIYRCLTTDIQIGRKTIPGLGTCESIVREMEFLYPIPTRPEDRPPPGPWQGDRQDRIRLERGYIKGFIDLIFEFQGRVYLVDWKSDILADYSGRSVARHVFREYQLQAQLYTIALARMLEIETESQHRRRFGGLLYCFMRGMGRPPDAEGRQPAIFYTRPPMDKLAELAADLENRDDYH